MSADRWTPAGEARSGPMLTPEQLQALKVGDRVMLVEHFGWGPRNPKAAPVLVEITCRTPVRARAGNVAINLRTGVVTPRRSDRVQRVYAAPVAGAVDPDEVFAEADALEAP